MTKKRNVYISRDRKKKLVSYVNSLKCNKFVGKQSTFFQEIKLKCYLDQKMREKITEILNFQKRMSAKVYLQTVTKNDIFLWQFLTIHVQKSSSTMNLFVLRSVTGVTFFLV